MTTSNPVETVFETVTTTATDIRDALAERRAYQDGQNPSGDRQLAADLYADELLEERLLALDDVATYTSEERETVIEGGDGSYHVACDPLDGSSNLKSNNGMGTVVAVYEERPPATTALVASGYVLYGPITTMVTASEGTVTEYLLAAGERQVLTKNLTLPQEPTVYGFGGRIPDWTDAFRTYVEDVETDRLKLRYSGAMVADVTQVLTYGGIFGYPMLSGNPHGKLRLLFEGHPIAHIVETAGGASSTGNGSVLDATPSTLHERSPVFVGNTGLIDRLESTLGQ